MIGQTRFHRGRDSETGMNTAEIVVSEMQRNGGFQMRELFAESVCKPRQSAKLHPHREVLPLHVRGGDMVGIRITAAHLGYDVHDWPWEYLASASCWPQSPNSFVSCAKFTSVPNASGALKV